MNRKTSLKIVRDADGSVLVDAKFSDADLSKKDKSEVLRNLIKDASSDMFDLTNWKGVMKDLKTLKVLSVMDELTKYLRSCSMLRIEPDSSKLLDFANKITEANK